MPWLVIWLRDGQLGTVSQLPNHASAVATMRIIMTEYIEPVDYTRERCYVVPLPDAGDEYMEMFPENGGVEFEPTDEQRKESEAYFGNDC